uniref:Uncharacterized protein n=1 Tax=Ixodes scapularis TaxID=6945 RepID=A0A1S4L3B6_IXOSC
MCETQDMDRQKKEMIDEHTRLPAENVNTRKDLERTNHEKRELSLKLAEMNDMLRNEELKDHFSNNRIHRKFIAERVHCWGEFYERLVRSVKTSVKKAIGRKLLTEEELGALLSEIEAVISSRQLTFIYNESQEPQPLSSSCFLVDKRLKPLPNPTVPDLKD